MTATLSALREDMRRMDGFRVLATRTLTDIRAGVADLLCAHDLEPAEPQHGCDASLSRIPVGGLSLIGLRYGSEVAVSPEPCSGFVMLQFVLSGWIQVEHAGGRFDCPANHGLILESLDQRRLRWSADCEQLIIPIQRAVIVRACETLTGRPAPARLSFDKTFSLEDSAGVSMVALARYLITHPAAGSSTHGQTGALAQEMLAHHLLLNHLDLGDLATKRSPVPYHVHRAEAFMRAHFAQDIDLDGMAAAAGVSTRTLTTAFRRFRQTSPAEWLRNFRLETARGWLCQGQAATVADVVLRTGFKHPGRFAQLYRERFGESPHLTLDAARRVPIQH